MSAGLDKFMKLPPSELGVWEDPYRNLKPNVRNVLDKIMRSEKFKEQTRSFGSAAKVLDSFWHWKTSVFNAHEYIGGISGEEPAVISKAEVSTVAEIFSKPWRTFERSWWEKHVREVQLPHYTKMIPTRIDDPDKVLEDIKAGRHIYGYFPEHVEPWLKGEEHYAPSLYTGEHFISFIRGDINDGTAVCGFVTNGDYYYVRTYTKGADVMKLVREMPQELKPYLGKDQFGQLGFRKEAPPEKPITVEEHAEVWSREFEEAKAKVEEREAPKVIRVRVEFPIKLVITPGYRIEQYPRGVTITEETVPISIMHRPNIGEVEDYVNQGKEELDLYEGLRQVGGDPKYILIGLQEWGMASYPQLASVFKKVEEDKWGEITDEEESQADAAWDEALAKEWVLTWTPADVEWKPEVLKDREIYHNKYSYDTLMAGTAEEVKNIARVKGVSLAGRKDEIARRVHAHDFGKEEVEVKLKEIDKLLG